MRYAYALMGIFLLLVASASAGSFTIEMDVDTYVDVSSSDQSFSDDDILWASSASGEPVQEVYLSFVNLFGSQSIFKPEQIKSAVLKLDASRVEKPGKVTAYFLHGATLDTATWDDKEDYNSEVSSASVNIDKAGSYTLDVSPIIKKAVEECTEGCPYSIVLVADGDVSIGFTSSEGSEENKPTLEYRTGD